MSPSDLLFDAATHTYYHDGRRVPGVTEILQPLVDFGGAPQSVIDTAAAFGTAVHAACELDDLGELDEASLDPSLCPYLEAWRTFCADHDAQWEWIEGRVFHRTLRYAGTLDRYGTVNGVGTVVDIKTTAQLYPSVGPQLAAYATASEMPVVNRMAVQLRADGTYVTKLYDDPADWSVFVSLLTLRNWCAANGVTPNWRNP